MCQINNLLRNTGDASLTCYKVLTYREKDDTYASPMYYYWWKKGVNVVPETELYSFERPDYIDRGYFHMFLTEEDAENYKSSLMDTSSLWNAFGNLAEFVVVKMSIPPHTYYYTGETGGTYTSMRSVAAKTVIFE